jgi:hypothetical protein
MAIKGKRKSKARSGRTVTAGPRPVYVRPKTPVFQRTGTKVLLVVLAEAAVFLTLVGFDVQSDREHAQDAIGEFSQLVDAAMFQGGVVQPLPAGALVLPEMGQTISTLGTEEADPEQITEQAAGWSEAATAAAERVGAIEVPEEGLEPEQRLALIEARGSMERGLLAYSTLADAVGITVRAEGTTQQDLIPTVQEQFILAGTIFDTGYSKLQEERRKVGLPTGTAPPGGLVPGGSVPGLPGGIPGLPGGEIPGLPGGELPVEPAPESS